MKAVQRGLALSKAHESIGKVREISYSSGGVPLFHWLFAGILALFLNSVAMAQSPVARPAVEQSKPAVAVSPKSQIDTHGSLPPRSGERANSQLSGVRPVQSQSSLQMILGLVIVVLIILGLWWVGRLLMDKPGSHRSSRAVQVISRTTVTPKQQVYLLKVGKRVLVVGNNGNQLNTLSEITDADEVCAIVAQITPERHDSISRTFSGLFGKEEEKIGQKLDMKPEPADDDAQVVEEAGTTREEISGLLKTVRGLTQQFKT